MYGDCVEIQDFRMFRYPDIFNTRHVKAKPLKWVASLKMLYYKGIVRSYVRIVHLALKCLLRESIENYCYRNKDYLYTYRNSLETP